MKKLSLSFIWAGSKPFQLSLAWLPLSTHPPTQRTPRGSGQHFHKWVILFRPFKPLRISSKLLQAEKLKAREIKNLWINGEIQTGLPKSNFFLPIPPQFKPPHRTCSVNLWVTEPAEPHLPSFEAWDLEEGRALWKQASRWIPYLVPLLSLAPL